MENVLLSPFNLHFLSVTSSMSSFSELLFRLCLTCLSVCDYQVCVLDIKDCGCPPLLTSPSVEPENPDACVSAVSNSCLALRFCLLSPPFLFPLVSFLCSLCLQEEGVVSFCKVCALGLVNSSFPPFTERYVKSTPSPCAPRTPHVPVLLTPHPLPLPKPLQQHVPQSIRNQNYPSCLWAGRCSLLLALWG